MFETFHFLRPEWLWAILPVSLLLFFSIRRAKPGSAWDDVCDAPLLHYQLTQQQNNTSTSSRIFHWLIPFSFLMLIFSFTIAALAGPSWEKKDQPVFQQEDALVIILDLSLSMNAEDIKPSRLERAKLKLTDILQQKKEGQTALVAFAGDAHIVSPLTIDNKTIISLLPALDITIMPLSGSHINDALSSAAELLKNSGFMRGDILLMTDGIDEKHQKKVRKKIKSLKNQGYNLSIIGIGTRAGSPIPIPRSGGFIKDSAGQVVLSKLNTGPLKELAQLGGGSYHTLSLDDSDFQSLLDKEFSTNNKLTEQDKQNNYQEKEKEHEQWVDAGAYITLLILPLALLVFRKGLLSISLVFLLGGSFFIHPVEAQAAAEPSVSDASISKLSKAELSTAELSTAEPPNSQAAAFTKFTQNKSWKNLWSTPDQQGQKAFNNKSYSAAAEQFNNARWKAGSYYRAGDFEQAVEQYEQLDDAHSLFNKGNSLAHLQKYEEAIQSYDDALEKNPDLPDAVKNRAAIKEFLQKQKQQSEQEKQKESEKDEDKKQDQNKDQDSQQENSEQDKKDQSEQQDQQNQSENNNSEQDTEQKSEQNSEQNTEQEKEQDKKDQNNQSEQPDEAAEEKQKQEAEEQAEEKDSQAAEQQEIEKTDAEAGENTADDVLSQLSQEQQQSLKQWLQRIPDNPGELLRIKFRNNSLNKQRQQNAPEQYEGNPW